MAVVTYLSLMKFAIKIYFPLDIGILTDFLLFYLPTGIFYVVSMVDFIVDTGFKVDDTILYGTTPEVIDSYVRYRQRCITDSEIPLGFYGWLDGYIELVEETVNKHSPESYAESMINRPDVIEAFHHNAEFYRLAGEKKWYLEVKRILDKNNNN